MTVPHDNPDNISPDISATEDRNDTVGNSPLENRGGTDFDGSQRGEVNIEQHGSLT